jgi:endo-1,4-beta-xylanase
MRVISFASISAILAVASAVPAPASRASGLSRFSPRNTALSRRAGVNYSEHYLEEGANVTYSPDETTGTFSVKYNTSEDFIVGLGWQPGDSR